MTEILLTGFEPFGGALTNASAEVVRHFETSDQLGAEVRTLILPVHAYRAPELLTRHLLLHRPTWCVMLGQAEGRASLSIERVAVNLLDFSIPDNSGYQPVDQPIVSGSPAAYFSTLPLRDMCAAARQAGVPADLSLSAGSYLCNLVFYHALHTCALHNLQTRCGFIHLPALPQQAIDARKPLPTMALETICVGLRACLSVLTAEGRLAVNA